MTPCFSPGPVYPFDRGVYLDTEPEMDEVYSQKAFLGDPKKLADFRQLYEYADKHASTDQSHGLDPDDSYAITKAYEQMIARGDEMAMWQWYVFENNLMEEDPQNLLDPNKIVETKMAEAQSTAFFETRFWIHETWEIPSNFFGRVDRLTNIPIWICQGLRDKVCPPQNAHHLVESMRSTTRSAPIHDRFIESGHEDTDPVMEECLVESMDEFLQSYH
jgi:pimeloyl-ACP methyl ester carboxylesterase